VSSGVGGVYDLAPAASSEFPAQSQEIRIFSGCPRSALSITANHGTTCTNEAQGALTSGAVG